MRNPQNLRKVAIASMACLALYACGGGGDAGNGSGSTGGTPTPAFVPGNSAEQAYFSGSYEFVGGDVFPTEHGYVSNAVDSTGALNRTRYQANAGVYTVVVGIFAFQIGFLGADMAILDPWLNDSGGVVRNATAGTYLLGFPTPDWFTISGIAEIDVAGQTFSTYLRSSALNGHDGVFPAGSKAYTASYVSKQDIYLASNGGSLFAGVASDHYFSDNYNTPSHAYCLNATQGLVFDSPTQATTYPLVVFGGTSCVVDGTAPGAIHVVSSHQAGTQRFFDFSNNQVQATDFKSAFFSAPGASTQHFALVIDSVNPGQVGERSGYVFAAGSRGSDLAVSGLRMNKIAINAVLAASSLPLVP